VLHAVCKDIDSLACRTILKWEPDHIAALTAAAWGQVPAEVIIRLTIKQLQAIDWKAVGSFSKEVWDGIPVEKVFSFTGRQIQQVPPEVVGSWTAAQWEKVPIDKFVYFTKEQMQKVPISTLKDIPPNVLAKFKGTLKDKLTQEQLAALSKAQKNGMESTEGLKEEMQKLLGSKEEEWAANDKVISASLAYDEEKATAGASDEEINQLRADLKNAELKYEAAVASREEAERASQGDQADQVNQTDQADKSNAGILFFYASMGVLVVAIPVLVFHSKRKAASRRAPPLRSQNVAVALETNGEIVKGSANSV